MHTDILNADKFVVPKKLFDKTRMEALSDGIFAVALTLLSGPPLAFLSYAGFLFVPLAHGGSMFAAKSNVIDVATFHDGGLLTDRIWLK